MHAVCRPKDDRTVTTVTDDSTAAPPGAGATPDHDADDPGGGEATTGTDGTHEAAAHEPGANAIPVSDPTVASARVPEDGAGDAHDTADGSEAAPPDEAADGGPTTSVSPPLRTPDAVARDGSMAASVGADAVIPLDSPITQSRVGGLVGFVAGVLLLRPWLTSGELLVRDLAAVAEPAINLDALAGGLGPTSDLLGQSLAVAAGQFLGMHVVVRLVLLMAFTALGAGAGRLAGTNGSRVAAAVAAMAAAWNPFVWARLNQGEWLAIVALAALPWIVIHLRADHRWRLARATLVAGLAGAAGWTIAVPTLLVVAIAARRFRAAAPALLVLVGSAVPAVLAAGRFDSDPAAFEAMSAVPDLRTGLLTSVVTGGAHWNPAVLAESRQSWLVALLAIVVAGGAIYGAGRWRESPRLLHDWRTRSGLVLAAVIGLVGVLFMATSAGQAVVSSIAEVVPWAAALRNSTNLLAPWVLMLAIGLGHLAWRMVSWLRRGPLRSSHLGVRRLTAHGMAILGIVVVVLTLPDPQWGQRLPEPGAVPPSWSLAADIVNEDPTTGSVLLVPGDRYQDLDMASVPVTPPLQVLVATNVLADSRWEVVRADTVLVVDDNPSTPGEEATPEPTQAPGATASPPEDGVVIDPTEVGDTPTPSTSGPTSGMVRTLASQWPADLDARALAEVGVGWVAVIQPDRVAAPGDGLVQVLEAPEIQLVQVDPEQYRIAEVERGLGVLLVDGLIATLALALLLAAGPLRTGKEMDPV